MANPIRKMPLAAAIYVTGDVLVKAAGFFLLPVMTRFLTPQDYGIMAGVTAFAAVLSLFLQLNLNGALMRFYPDAPDDESRKDIVGTLVLFSMAWSLVVVLLINVAGGALLDNLYIGVRFEPYLRLATWIAIANSFTALPLCLLQMQQRPVMHRVLSLTGFLLNTAFVLIFVVGLRLGAYGAVMGQLAGAAAASIPFLLLLRRYMRPVLKSDILKTSLVFSLPLVLYAVGGWVMDTSNRVFIERFVNLPQLGLFNVGHQFSMVLGFIVGATGLAFTPIFYETVKIAEGPRLLARFGVIYVAVTLGCGLVIAVLAREALIILTQPQYHDAYRVVPVLTATQALTGFWHLAVNPLMLKRKTGYLTGLMGIAAAGSVGLNLYLIPRYGIMGAAVSPLVANVFLTAAVFLVSARLYPVPYNYRHFALIVAVALLVFGVAGMIFISNALVSFGVRLAVLGLYPALLMFFGVITLSDLRRIRESL
jgi:O-antigen/teichoic acid export membrane protein